MQHEYQENGISVIICCFNSKDRLYPTLLALSKQVVQIDLSWEIIIVDNASTDKTDKAALKIWQSFKDRPDISFSIAHEWKPGQTNARKKGISLSSYNYLLFCDDDNWLSDNYVQSMYNILSSDRTIGACGGKGIPVFETEKPHWFDLYGEAYAVGAQSITSENNKIIHLYGAGLGLNKTALNVLEKSGFTQQMNGRTGEKLSSSDDTELTYALLIMGYKLHYEDKLEFFHYLPKERLQWSYLRKLFTAFGADGPIRNIYYAHITVRNSHRLNRYWIFHVALSGVRLIKYLLFPPKKFGREIYYKWNIAYIKSLFALRSQNRKINKNISLLQEGMAKTKESTIREFSIIST